ncbi:MAG: DUF1292 domain-containing protein [Lachnospiraceae bacterium]|nr:DUF1292 domain-containing protein [Lachnospiraceae bacterium]
MDTDKNRDGRKIPFMMEDGTQVQFCVLEQTRFYGVDYLLVTEDFDSPEAEALILKDLSGATSSQALYEIVEDETELRAVAAVFEELLEDVDLL